MQKTAYWHRFAWLRYRSVTKTLLALTPAGAGSHRTNRTLIARTMKLTIVLLTVVLLQAHASVVSQTITYSGKNVVIKKVFTAIEEQTGYAVLYNAGILKTLPPATCDVSNMPLRDFLTLILKGFPVNFRIEGKTIALARKVSSADAFADMSAPVLDLFGWIISAETREPVVAASISVKGGKSGATSNNSGIFSLSHLSDSAVIVISSVGYYTIEVPISRLNSMDNLSTIELGNGRIRKFPTQFQFEMFIADNVLDEAVMTAFGRTSRRTATANIGKVTGEEIRKQPVMNPLLALQGKVAGLSVLPTSGYANAPVKVEIRGRNNINPLVFSEPLYVVDGIPFTVLTIPSFVSPGEGVSSGVTQAGVSSTGGQSPLFGLNSMDIESIEVLKDGDATAIYGSRAANGVILITTKKARSGKTSFDIGWTEGVSYIARQLDMLRTPEYLAIRREALSNDGVTPTAQNAPDLKVWDSSRDINWQKQIYGTGRSKRITAGLSGGDYRNAFRISGQYQNETPMLRGSSRSDVASFRVNTNHRSPNSKLTADISADYTYSKIKAINEAGTVASLPPNAPPAFNEAGKLNYEAYGTAGLSNFPFAYLLNSGVTSNNMLNSNLSIAYDFGGGFFANLRGGFRSVNNENNAFSPAAAQDPRLNPSGSTIFGKTQNTNWLIEPQLGYSVRVGGGLLDIKVGGKLEKTTTSAETIFAYGYTNDALLTGLAGAAFSSVQAGKSFYKYNAAYTRINYDWEHKYILNMNVTRDGSSRFGPGRQFGNFGSAALAWIASEESWMKEALPSWVSFLKLRGSYAITGSDGVGDYQYLTRWGSSVNFNPLQDYNGVRAFTSTQPVNQDYRWEANRQLDLSMNVGFFHDKLLLEAGVYRKRSGSQITQLPTPAYSGFTQVVANWDDALVENAGIEGTISARIIETKTWNWNFNVNISKGRNKLVSYPGIERSPYAARYKVGESLQTTYVLNLLGVNPMTGKYEYEDYNKDGVITERFDLPAGTGNDDRYISFDQQASYQGGFNSGLQYKSIRLNLGFSYIKQWVADPFYNSRPGMMKNLVFSDEYQSATWRHPGDISRYALITTNTNGLRSYPFTDGSYLRLQNVALSWNLPETLLRKAKMSSAALSVFAQDLFTITKFKGIDPRIASLSTLPMPTIITANLSVTF